MESLLSLRTGAWYGDNKIELPVPPTWDIRVLSPATPPPLDQKEIDSKLKNLVGQPSFHAKCKGKSRPLIIVDDLNRPTPTLRIMPILLRCLGEAGIPAQNVTILMATGSHGRPLSDAISKKIGREAASRCRVLIHDCFRDVKRIGKTSFGTPVFVNQNIMECDMVIGVSGIYPNHTAGFGGGSKLALGVLGIRTIYHLHFRHLPAGWGGSTDSPFRQELDEIAGMMGMNTLVSLVIDANRQIIQMYCGNQRESFQEAVAFCRQTFRTCLPADADVIISNTYPSDVSLMIARMKGFVPLDRSCGTASRIAIASCSEGLGLHNIYPFVNLPPHYRLRHIMRRLSALSIGEVFAKSARFWKRKVWNRIKRSSTSGMVSANGTHPHRNPVWLYRPGNPKVKMPSSVPGIRLESQWSAIVDAVQREQAGKENLRVLVYPCASLQLPEESSFEVQHNGADAELQQPHLARL